MARRCGPRISRSGEPLVGDSPLFGWIQLRTLASKSSPIESLTTFRPPQRFVRLLSLVAHYLAGAHFCAKDDAVVSGGDPLRRAAAA